jgi:hypothetical protein
MSAGDGTSRRTTTDAGTNGPILLIRFVGLGRSAA